MNAISDAIPGSMLDMPATTEEAGRACQDMSRRS